MTQEQRTREEFHKFSLFMANAVEQGDAKYKDIEQAISDWWLSKRREELKEMLEWVEGQKKKEREDSYCECEGGCFSACSQTYNQCLKCVEDFINQRISE